MGLVCAGGSPFQKDELEKLRSMALTDKVFQYPVTDEELAYFYSNALALVYPSLNEGFGIPILEAFHNNCLVILSERSCFPEVAGDAAIYFDPSSQDFIVDVLTDTYNNLNDYRVKLVPKGKKRLEIFTVDRMIKKTMSVYKKI